VHIANFSQPTDLLPLFPAQVLQDLELESNRLEDSMEFLGLKVIIPDGLHEGQKLIYFGVLYPNAALRARPFVRLSCLCWKAIRNRKKNLPPKHRSRPIEYFVLIEELGGKRIGQSWCICFSVI
jgi:hypothetical protein